MQSTASSAVRGASFNVNSAFNPCVLIPVFNHGPGLAATLAELAPLHHAVIVVDDGSGQASRAIIDAAVQSRTWVRLLRRAQNGGRGRSKRWAGTPNAAAIRSADRRGPANTTPRHRPFWESREHPGIRIGAARLMTASRGASHRAASHFWVHINTLSYDIEDSMCGFRVHQLRS
jgi:glycosyltransferase involved in cell wall biosynthesis